LVLKHRMIEHELIKSLGLPLDLISKDLMIPEERQDLCKVAQKGK